MGLTTDLISEFVKITKDDTPSNSESFVYGTVKKYDGLPYVQLDGSEVLTRMSTTADVEVGERVTVMIKDHKATITGNLNSPSARTGDVSSVTAKVSELSATVAKYESIVVDSVSTEELEAEKARIDTLITENATIKSDLKATNADIETLEADTATISEKLTAAEADIETLEADTATISEKLTTAEADIGTLEANNATITNRLTATEADVKTLKTSKLDATTANITFAKISDLNAATADITDLESTFGDFKVATTDKLSATDALIEDLQTNKLSASDIEGKYANIDFSNIGKAAMEYFYSESGLIENVTVGDATITGELVGVTIKGDLIEGNTIKAEKLVIKGTDGLYYKLNTDGVTTEAEQTSQNSLNGNIIMVNSITASKISVDDLVAFDATIGGFNITNNSIYSGVKETVDNNTRGIYLDNAGQMALGDATNFIKYYKDQNGKYKLEISADSVLISSGDKNVETVLNEVSEATQTNASDLVTYISSTNAELENLQGQIDGSISTWFYEYVPTSSNVPASEWTTTDLKNNHLGDLFYNTLTGYCYRWQVKDNTYSWNRITDVDVTKALADAAAAQDTADNKRRVFVETPTVPYDVGDLWVQGTSGDILRCQTKKTSSQSYVSADWVKASKYTDDTAANTAQKNVDALSTRVSTAETTISKNEEDIKLMATKTEVAESLSGYYTKEQSDSNLTVKANEITTNVASTYATKTSLATTDANVSAVQEDVNNLTVGGRNLALATAFSKYTNPEATHEGNNAITFNRTGYVSGESRRFVGYADSKLTIDGIRAGDVYTISAWVYIYDDVELYKPDNTTIHYRFYDGTSMLDLSVALDKAGDIRNEWVFISDTITIGKDIITQSQSFTIGGYDGHFLVASVKVERGNKATDWTPAPEDVESYADTVANDAKEAAIESINTTLESYATLTVTDTKISSTVSTSETTLKKYADEKASSAESNAKSYVDQTANSITSSVAEIYTTKETFDSLKIGGRNLLLGTSEEWQAANQTQYYNVLYSRPVSELDLEEGDWLTASVWFKNPEDATKRFALRIQFYTSNEERISVYSPVNIDIGTEDFVELSFEVTAEMLEYTTIHFCMTNGDTSITATETKYYRKAKLEKGNRATDWTQAPEDVDEDISALDVRVGSAESSITQLSNKITTNVTETDSLKTRMSTVEQTSSGLTVRLDTVEDDVSTAQSTADAAKTAASNAQSTANSAKTNAATAQSTANTAKTNAATAQSTADTAKTNAATAQLTADAAKTAAAIAQADIDELEIGGRNLLRGTSSEWISINTNQWYNRLRESKGEYTSIETYGLKVGDTITYSLMLNGGDYGGIARMTFYSNTSGGDKETVTGNKIAAGEVGLSKITYTIDDTDLYFNVAIQNGDTTQSSNVVSYKEAKLEVGNRATGWSPAPEDVQTATEDAAKTATNYLNFSDTGLVVGDMTANTLGKNVLIDSDSVDVRNGETTLASFGASEIVLGQNSEDSVINLCDGAGKIKTRISEASTSYPKYDAITIESQEIEMNCQTFSAITQTKDTSSATYTNTADVDLLSYSSSEGGFASLSAKCETNSSGDYCQTGFSSMAYEDTASTRSMMYAWQWDESANSYPQATSNQLNVYPKYTSMSKPLKIQGTEFTGENKVLWSGAVYMLSGQSATLSESISDQANGVVLVWSEYTDGASVNANFNTFFIPKYFVSAQNGKGIAMLLTNATCNVVASKYVYVTLTKINGYSNNNADEATKSSGIKTTPKRFVLRYVIGV